MSSAPAAGDCCATPFCMFPLNQCGLAGRVLDWHREDDVSCRLRRARVSFGLSRAPILLRRRDWMKKIRVRSVCVALIGAAALTAAVYGQEKKDSPAPPKIVHFGDLKWTPIFKGCDLATVAGDPSARHSWCAFGALTEPRFQ